MAAAQVRVEGVVLSRSDNKPVEYAFVINYRTQNGTFCDQNGFFSINVRANDSLLISQTGFKPIKVFLADSTNKNPININVYLEVKIKQLPTFTVRASKTFEQIIRELEIAEKSARKKEVAVIDAATSPVTFLYQQFSKQERARQKIAELRAEDMRMKLLRTLFTRYMLANIIEIREEEMDDFIRFSGLADVYTQFESEYDLVVYVKERFKIFKKQ